MAVDAEITVGSALPDEGAPAGSPMFDLRRIRAEKFRRLHLDLQVPRWADGGGPEVWVRYGPVRTKATFESLERRQRAAKKSRDGVTDAEWVVLTNADLLVSCCQAVYLKADGQTFTLTGGQWSAFDLDAAPADRLIRFGPELADALGIADPGSAAGVCRALFFTDGDLQAHAGAVSDWSGVEVPKAEGEALGE